MPSNPVEKKVSPSSKNPDFDSFSQKNLCVSPLPIAIQKNPFEFLIEMYSSLSLRSATSNSSKTFRLLFPIAKSPCDTAKT